MAILLKDRIKEDPSVFQPGGAMYAQSLLERTLAKKSPALKEDAPKKTALSGEFDDSAQGPAEDKDSTLRMMMYFSMFAANSADSKGTVGSSDITQIIDALEKIGLDVSPIKTAIETATGKSYKDFTSSQNSGTRFDVSGFYSENDKGDRVPFGRSTSFNSLKALNIAETDNAGKGKCGRGVYNITHGMGWNVTAGNGTDWDNHLNRSKDWVLLKGVTAKNAPEGTVLVYNSDLQAGRGLNENGKGAEFGHVEIVAEGRNGQRLYVADRAYHNPGGSVPQNFAGAYMYVGPNAPAENLKYAKSSDPSHSPAGPAPAIS